MLISELPLSRPLSPEQVSRLWEWVNQASQQEPVLRLVPQEFQNLLEDDWLILVEELNLVLLERQLHQLQ
jgi:hypothetical protein